MTTTAGWYVDSTKTNLQSGTVNEFVSKEGKYFNNIKGDITTELNIDTAEFTVQGIGRPTSIQGDVNPSVFRVNIYVDPNTYVDTNP